MCMILNTKKLGNDTVLDCSEYNGEFLSSKILKILDENNELFSTADFTVEKSKPCFGSGGQPWVMIHGAVPQNFLKKGNTILFEG